MRRALEQVVSELTIRVGHNAKSKSFSYWLSWMVVVGLGLWISPTLEASAGLREVRYRVSSMIDWLTPRHPKPRFVSLVEIGDEELFGPMQGEHPLPRDYLARLVRAIAFYHPAVIVLDVDLSFDSQADKQSARPSNNERAERRRHDEAELHQAIVAAGDQSRIVLPMVLRSPGTFLVGDDLHGPMIAWGFLELPKDHRQVPTYAPDPDPNSNDKIVYSLSMAAARAYSPGPADDVQGEGMPYISFIPEDVFQSNLVSAGELLANTPISESAPSKPGCAPTYSRSNATFEQTKLFFLLNSKIALVGANIGERFKGDTHREDMFGTPAGIMPGYKLHANYIEALLNNRAMPGVHEPTMIAVEMAVTLLLTVVLISSLNDSAKFIFMFFALMVLALLSYVFNIAFGLFAEVLIPAVLVVCHFVVDIILEWRREAHRHSVEHTEVA